MTQSFVFQESPAQSFSNLGRRRTWKNSAAKMNNKEMNNKEMNNKEEEEGLPIAEREAMSMEEAIGVEMDEEEVMRRALLRWKMMGLEEKAFWRREVEEKANKKI